MRFLERNGKCGRAIVGYAKGAIAPSFYLTRIHVAGMTSQMMWFCNTDVTHTRVVDKITLHAPHKVPLLWLMVEGSMTVAGFNSS